MPRAEHFGEFITADHKIFSEESESRNNHRYAVVLQDLATQVLQSYPCQTKTSQESQKSLIMFLEPIGSRKSFTENSVEFGKAFEELSWNHCTSTPHRSETYGIAESLASDQHSILGEIVLEDGSESLAVILLRTETHVRAGKSCGSRAPGT